MHDNRTSNLGLDCKNSNKVEKNEIEELIGEINIDQEEDEAHKVVEKEIYHVDEQIEPGRNNNAEIEKENPRDYQDSAETYESNQETLAENNENDEKKKSDGTERLLTKEALYHACENWTRKVLEF
ncbi:hypothetical protein C2G38_2038579 [Gigaspora rosea]|uniref:Uncharacterized protein n=1 Tax=Gigaspora rosea TaxID=44941 RepID=A0A397V493_9GLOM|nr:hypothetical protein C2G38_2038579 [Gigaspora rosea]